MATVKTSLFSSERERRLWFWTLAVVAAIYSTLGLAATLEGKLPHGLFAQTFFIGFLMIGAAILTQGLRARPGGTEIGVALGVAAAYLMTFARLGGAERSHLFEYGVLALFVHEALAERAIQGRRVSVPALLAIVVSTLIGVLDESIQVVAAQPRV